MMTMATAPDISGPADGKTAEQEPLPDRPPAWRDRTLTTSQRARNSNSAASAASRSAFDAGQEKAAAELAGDEPAFGADKMQHFNDVAIAGHSAARGKNHRQRRGRQNQRQNAQGR